MSLIERVRVHKDSSDRKMQMGHSSGNFSCVLGSVHNKMENERIDFCKKVENKLSELV